MDKDTQKKFTEYTKRRGHARAALTRLENLTTAHTELQDAYVYLEQLERCYRDFEEYDQKLEAIDPDSSEITQFEQRFLKLKAKLRGVVHETNPLLTAVQKQLNETMTSFNDHQRELLNTIRETSIAASPRESVKLPPLDIPPFYGRKSEEFQSFKDIFETVVDKNAAMSDCQKLSYLKGLLKGDAYTFVRHIAVTAANYKSTWEKVCKRFDQPSQVIRSFVKRFLDQPSAANNNAHSLRKVVDTSIEVIAGLRALGEEAESRDIWINYILMNKLDDDSRRAWASKTVDVKYPTSESLVDFLEKRCIALENCEISNRRPQPGRQINEIKSHHAITSKVSTLTQPPSQASVLPRTITCRKCSSNHRLQDCEEFKLLDVNARKDFVASSGCCFNCLAAGHTSKLCRSFRRCYLCRKKHHTVLHTLSEANDQDTSSQLADPNADVATTTSNSKINVHTALLQLTPVLPTARIIIRNSEGDTCIGRMLLDSGSNSCMISEACVNRLNLPRSNARYRVEGIASKSTTKGLTMVEISPHFRPELKLEIQAYIMQDLPSKIPRANPELLEEWDELDKATLADPTPDQNDKIDVLMGAGQFMRILSNGKLEGPNKLIAQNTMFGWIIGGGEAHTPVPKSFSINLEFNIDDTLRRFWELEELPAPSKTTMQEHKCEKLFRDTTYRDKQGRFVVRLPFIPNSSPLGESRSQAISRFFSIEKRLQSDAHLRNEYIRFMDDYFNANHMEELTADDLAIPVSNHFYLPHHPVIKLASTTTKVRVVFDGSAVTKSSVSLNQTLMVGPTVQSDLASILTRFRLHRIAFTADIQQMYRQVRIHPDHYNFQRILWRRSPTEPLKHFKLTTVTYGTSSAAYLATRALVQLANDVESTNPATASIIKNDFYVDDVLSGDHSDKAAIASSKDLQLVLSSAGFKLHKWASNSEKFLRDIDAKEPVSTIAMMKDSPHKVLGLHWNCEGDNFIFKSELVRTDLPLTKRKFLSDASRLFDPLGWLSPITITVKVLFQKLWLLSIGWDDPVPSEIANAWTNLQVSMEHVERIKIPRHMRANEHYREAHGFCDASKVGYAAAVYLRTTDSSGEVQVYLIAAKTKVSPIRPVTIPRMELLAAHLLAKLSKSVILTLKIEKAPSYSWTDSEIVLHWLSKQPATLPTFIANRTSQIHEWLPQTKWQHVSTKSNPCDCASRGLKPAEIINHTLWWKGPEWLCRERTDWPEQKVNNPFNSPKPTGIHTIHVNEVAIEMDVLDALFDKISEQRTIKRIIGWCIRFIHLLVKGHRKATRSQTSNTAIVNVVTPLTCDEIKTAERCMWRWAQRSEYEREIKALNAGVSINNSNISSLSPFLDKEGILRVGGRLTNANCSDDAKHQVILPKSHRLTVAILTSMHTTYLHPTASTLFHLSRQKYWIISGKVLAKRVTNACKICFKIKSQPMTQIMGDLPNIRTAQTRCFSKVGVDYAGPFQATVKRSRGTTPTKAYVALFICMAVKAIHLEPVMDLTTEAFIGALRRFASRRNNPTDIFSDNGTNFKGASRKLSELSQAIHNPARNLHIAEYLSEKGTRWHFIPPASPSMGGLWEAGVKCMKHHLIRATNNATLSLEEFSTLLCEIEAILNSRPLTPMSMDPNDNLPLTPAHFLLTGPLEPVADENLQNTPENRLDRWQNIQKRVQGYWRRFSREYLHTLQQRRKWQQQHTNLEIGDLVYLKDEDTTPLNWPLGRIVDVHPGKDGVTRVVSVKARRTILKRPITKIIKLPVEVDCTTNSTQT